jgi:hypothetical protein
MDFTEKLAIKGFVEISVSLERAKLFHSLFYQSQKVLSKNLPSFSLLPHNYQYHYSNYQGKACKFCKLQGKHYKNNSKYNKPGSHMLYYHMRKFRVIYPGMAETE